MSVAGNDNEGIKCISCRRDAVRYIAKEARGRERKKRKGRERGDIRARRFFPRARARAQKGEGTAEYLLFFFTHSLLPMSLKRAYDRSPLLFQNLFTLVAHTPPLSRARPRVTCGNSLSGRPSATHSTRYVRISLSLSLSFPPRVTFPLSLRDPPRWIAGQSVIAARARACQTSARRYHDVVVADKRARRTDGVRAH